MQEEVVAQLRQLNRTAPRPKVKKQATKVKSSTSLTGLANARKQVSHCHPPGVGGRGGGSV